jgi:hypothetical protein
MQAITNRSQTLYQKKSQPKKYSQSGDAYMYDEDLRAERLKQCGLILGGVRRWSDVGEGTHGMAERRSLMERSGTRTCFRSAGTPVGMAMAQ